MKIKIQGLCVECKGKKTVTYRRMMICFPAKKDEFVITCPVCQGTGKGRLCPRCLGWGGLVGPNDGIGQATVMCLICEYKGYLEAEEIEIEQELRKRG